MRKGVLVCFGTARQKNIGDYMQSLAARQFAGSDAMLLEREKLHQHSGELTRLVMNGWFMHHPSRFPPSEAVVPLFVSFHVRPKIESRFFTEKAIAYLKAHEPIGCRSTEMVDMLARHGIRGEYTSCLTLTLGETYRHVLAETPPVFVDPYLRKLPLRAHPLRALGQMLSRIPYALAHAGTLFRLSGRFKGCCLHFPGIRFAPIRWYYLTEFYRIYSTAFSDELLLSADYLSHGVVRTKDSTDETFMAKADELMRRYEKAPYVVTSRLHCALPCIGIGTPVWVPFCPSMTTGRFDGNVDFMNLLTFGPDGRCQPPLNGKVTSATPPPPVRTEHRPFAEALADRCRKFFCESEDRKAELK